jgi:hypothetical protein
MGIAARLDDIGKPVWIMLMILGFILFWPLGLAMLAFLIGSGRMGCWGHGGSDRWQRKMERFQEKMGRMQGMAERWHGGARSPASSGNRAFDEYRTETLRRLEEEEREFRDFLDRLRFAKDKAEFDQFLNDRRNRPPGAPEPQPQG